MDNILEDYKLNTSYRRLRSRLPKGSSRGQITPQQDLSAGVSSQATDKGEQRVVKAIRKTLAVKYGVARKGS